MWLVHSRTFIANHMSVTAACDFFVVPTLTFKSLYCFVVLSHDRRKILHVNVTRHPTDEWTARQILEAFPGDGFVPKYLHRDRDCIYGRAFRRANRCRKERIELCRELLDAAQPAASPASDHDVAHDVVVLSHDRRKILHINVTRHPTDEWAARQMLEAFPGDGFVPKYLHRDRDCIYGRAFRRTLSLLGITDVVSARKSPWQNPFAERVIGSIRRECTDHIVALGECHLSRVLQRYPIYHNQARTHLSLDRNAPLPRAVEQGDGAVVAIPHLRGLHHRYTRAA